jgi:hypothetical protein
VWLVKRVNVYDDVFGRIFLNSLDPQDVWYKVLNAVDIELVHDRYLRAQRGRVTTFIITIECFRMCWWDDTDSDT